MSGKVFWIAAVLLLAIIVHLGYVLFAPRFEMNSRIEEIRRLAGGEGLTVLSRDDGIRLMGPDGQWLVHALCVYDLARGPVRINAVIPSSYWSMSIYSGGGDNFYSLNDRQADVNELSIVLRPRKDEPAGDDLQVPEVLQTDSLTVQVPDSTGLVVMRALAAEAAEYGRVSKVLAGSSCRTVRG